MNLRTSINLSACMLSDPALPREIDHIVDGVGLTAAHFCFEVREQAMLTTDVRALHLLAELQSLGYRIVIDDFGEVGDPWKSLPHLPFDEVKISRKLMVKAQFDTAANEQFQMALAQASEAGLHRVAKGVETIDDWHFLGKQEVEEMQGYYLARPMPLDDLLVDLVESAGIRSPELIAAPLSAS